MKKLVIMGLLLTALSMAACAYHAKQPVNDEYYKQTRQVAWPDSSETRTSVPAQASAAVPARNNGGSAPSMGAPAAAGVKPGEKWEDADVRQQVAVPSAVKKKVQCTKKGEAYTCRYGETVCGWGCKSDGSNCSYGYCQETACDDVMGQKWEWIPVEYEGSGRGKLYSCKHPDYSVYCYPHGNDGILCSYDRGYYFYSCGTQCNKNGTDCGIGANNCWDRYR